MKRMIEGNMHLYDINVNYSCYEKNTRLIAKRGYIVSAENAKVLQILEMLSCQLDRLTLVFTFM